MARQSPSHVVNSTRIDYILRRRGARAPSAADRRLEGARGRRPPGRPERRAREAARAGSALRADGATACVLRARRARPAARRGARGGATDGVERGDEYRRKHHNHYLQWEYQNGHCPAAAGLLRMDAHGRRDRTDCHRQQCSQRNHVPHIPGRRDSPGPDRLAELREAGDQRAAGSGRDGDRGLHDLQRDQQLDQRRPARVQLSEDVGERADGDSRLQRASKQR